MPDQPVVHWVVALQLQMQSHQAALHQLVIGLPLSVTSWFWALCSNMKMCLLLLVGRLLHDEHACGISAWYWLAVLPTEAGILFEANANDVRMLSGTKAVGKRIT